MTLLFLPDKNPHTIEIGVWNTITQTQQWVDVSDFNPRLSVETAPAGGGTVQGTLHLEIPLEQDTVAFEAWNAVRVQGLVAGPPVGGYPRPFRGYTLQPTSQTRGLLKVYDFPLVDGWARVERSPGTIVTKRTYRGEDSEIIHAMAAQCMPELYPSGVATPSAPTSAATVTPSATGGTLRAGKWRVVWAWSNPSGPTAFSPYAIPFTTGTTSKLTVTIPGSLPAGATGAQIYMADDADSLTMVWARDVPGPGTYTLTDPPLGSLPPIAAIGPYPLNPTGDQPNVNNYSSVQPPGFGPLEVTVEGVRLAEALQAVIDKVPATYEVPRAVLWWTPDNAAHTAGWDWQLTWLRDSDTPIYAVVPSNVGNAATGQEDFVHAYYYGFQRTRAGAPIINVQDVEGDWLEDEGRYASAHVVSEVSQDEIGVYVSGKPIIDRDLKTDAECYDRARAVMDPVKLPGETLSNVVTFVPFALLGATRVRLRNTTEGGMDTAVEADLPVYAIARCQGEWTEIGWKYTLDLGTGFPEIGQHRAGFRGGAASTTSTQAPAQPTWHDGGVGDELDNSYDPVTHTVSLTASWNPNRETNLLAYYGRYFLNGATDWMYSQALPANVPPAWTIPGLPASSGAGVRHVVVQIQAQNTHGVRSAWSASRDFTPLAYRDAPAAPVWVGAYSTATESATLGNATLTWTDGAGGSGTPAYWEVTYVPHSGGQTLTLKTTLRAVLIHALLIGTLYDVTVQAFTADGDPGVVSAVKQITVPQDSPGAPATVTVTGTRTGPGRGQANLSWTAGTGGTGGVNAYEARYYVTASGPSTAVIVPVAADNRVLTIPGLPVGTSYTFNVRSLTRFGIPGPWSTSAPTLTLAAENPPAPTLAVLDYDPGSTGLSAWISLGLTPGVGGSGTPATYNVRVTWTESSSGQQRKWHKDGIPASETSTILSPVTAGPSYTITAWSVTAWGDVSGTPSTLVYTITPGLVAALYNGDFEIPNPANITLPDGWAVTVLQGTPTTALATDQVFSGARSLKMTATALSGGHARVQLTSRRFTVQPGDLHFVSLAARRSAGAGTSTFPSLSINYYDATGAAGPTELSPILTAGSAVWQTNQYVSGTAVPANMVQAEVVLILDVTTLSQTLWIDNVVWRTAPSAVDVAPGVIDTPAKFGSALAAIQKGSSNPASPSTNDRNWNTSPATGGRDLFWTGAYWATADLKIAPFVNAAGLTAVNLSNSNVGRLALSGDFVWLPVRFFAAFFVGGTNNASNYWTLTLRYITAGNTVTNLATMSTSAEIGNNWRPLFTTTFLVATIPTSAFMIEIIATTTGSPSSLLIVPSLAFREIVP